MAGLLYYFPRATVAAVREGDRFRREFLAGHGLDQSLGGVRSIDREFSLMEFTAAGPGDAPGAMLTPVIPEAPPPRIGFYPAVQTWTKVAAEPELWIGLDRDYPPRPDDLARPRVFPGHPVVLADGQTYQVPVIRSPLGGRSSLPRQLYHDPAGVLILQVRPEHEVLWAASGRVWDAFFEPDSAGTMTYSEILGHTLAFLGLNYRYGPREQSALRLVDTDNWREVMKAAVDWPAVEAEQKKTEEAAGMSSSPGPADSAPDTGPAVAS